MNRNFLRACTTIGALALLASCNDRVTTAPSATPLAPTDPSFGAIDEFNDEGVCLAADAYRSGFTSGVNSETSLLADSTKSCTSNDVRVAQADIISFSFDGVDYTTYTGQEVTCNLNQPIFVKVAAHLEETATSARSDIGIYIGLNGSNGRTGTCNHYNLIAPAGQGSVAGGVSNIDGDICGDMNAGAETDPPVELGVIDAICQSTAGSDLLHIGSCLTWTVPGSDQACPQNNVQSPNGFRWGTAPSSKSKCNCAGFDLPITVLRDPSVTLSKTADADTVNAGSPIGFTVTVTNAGPAAATNLVVTDTLPGGTGVLWSIETNPVPTGWSLSGAAGSQILTFSSSSFAIGSTSVHVVSNTTSGSCKAYVNRVRGTASNQTTVSLAADTTTVICPSLSITKTPASQTKSAGESFSWTVTLTNAGPGTAVGATINDSLPVATGVSYTLGTNSPAAANCAITSGKLVCGPLDLLKDSSITATINATTLGTAACGTLGNIATGSASNQSGIVADTANTTIACPNLSIVKRPDLATDPGGSITPPDSARFTIVVTNSAAAGTGSANNVVLTDTLPTGLTWVANNTTTCPSPMATVTVASNNHQKLVCNIGTLAAGDSFKVVVAAFVPTSFVQNPPSNITASVEMDGNLADDGAVAGKDWASLGINCSTPAGCRLDLATGSGDNSFGQGSKEDTPVPNVVSGSIPNNKSDLLRFYIANERVVSNDFLYLAWERVQAPNGTTNMDFEFNQSTTISGNTVTPVRTVGDLLVMYDLSKGGDNPKLAFSRWIVTNNPGAECEASNSTEGCWSQRDTILAGAIAKINTVSVSDPIPPNNPRTLDAFTFGEASIDLQTSGIFQPGECVSFGSAYLKSRSADAFTSELKDFIAPLSINVTNCSPVTLNNTAWVTASNVTAISNSGKIEVGTP